MDDMAAVAMEINPLLANRRTYQDLRQERRVKPGENAVTRRYHIAAASLYQRNKLLIPQSRCLVEGTPRGIRVGDTAAGGIKVFKKDSNPLSHGFMLVWKIGIKGLRQEFSPAGFVKFASLWQEAQQY
jgi:hypothetical protein